MERGYNWRVMSLKVVERVRRVIGNDEVLGSMFIFKDMVWYCMVLYRSGG